MKSEKVNPQGQVLGDLAGMAGFEPTSARVKVWCLTAWRHPNIQLCYYIKIPNKCQAFLLKLKKNFKNRRKIHLCYS